MATSTLPLDPPATAPQRLDRAPAHSTFEVSTFEASTFETAAGHGNPTRWIGWRRRGLVLVALLGCLAMFSLARWLALTPTLDAHLKADAQGQLLLQSSPRPELAAFIGKALLSVQGAGGPEVPVNGGLLHRSPRWQLDDAARSQQQAQQQRVNQALASGQVTLRFASGEAVTLRSTSRGYAGLGLMFWPLSGLALLVYLFGAVLLLARPVTSSLLYGVMAACQATSLWLIATESAPGLGAATTWPLGDMGLRVALDLCTAAAALQALVTQPRRLRHAGALTLGGWCVLMLWLIWAYAIAPALNDSGNAGDGRGAQLSAPWFRSSWLWAQTFCVLLAAAGWAAIRRSYQQEANPYALVMRRFSGAALATLLLVSAVVVAGAQWPAHAAGVAEGAAVVWYGLLATMLLLTPTLSRTRQVLREFALLAGISTVATSLDLLFVAVFSLGSYTSLAMAVFIALGLYAGARQWIVGHLLGSRMQTTERTFDQLYRAAREVQAQPAQYPLVLATLMRELFEPLELGRVERVPLRARVVGGGAALVVPVRPLDDESKSTTALSLRYAQRGQRLFTADDARLANRVIDQLRRAVAYDQAVERGRAEERQRIAQDLHDDIGARLLTLMYQSPTREMEDYIRHTLQDLKTLTRGLAASEHRLSHAAAEWKADLTQRLAAAHATLGWTFTYDTDLQLSVVQWSALTRVLRELVSNALYHGHATRIDVNFLLEGAQLTLQVADDGGGADPQAWAHGLGLGGVRKRVKLLGGKVAWRENQPRGIVCAVLVASFTGRG